MASNTTIKMIKLQSSDGKVFEVPETVARQSRMINRLIENMNSKPEGTYMVPLVISVPRATAEVLKKVITYCEKHAKATNATKTENKKAPEGSSTTEAYDEELDNWDKQFVDVESAMLHDFIATANYLKIDGLPDLASQKLADMVRKVLTS